MLYYVMFAELKHSANIIVVSYVVATTVTYYPGPFLLIDVIFAKLYIQNDRVTKNQKWVE